MEIKNLYAKFLNCDGISTDTRKIHKNSLFFALKGANFNANLLAEEALEKGAKYVVIDDKAYYKSNEQYILVHDVLQTLQALSGYHRKQLGLPIIALTGSNGKTTTKELINVVLSQKYKTVATEGNLNNHIGVPLTLLAMDQHTEIGIVEMGANHFNEIAFLCSIAQPDYGYITNFGKAHLEGFGSLEGVIKAKTELYQYLKNKQGIAFVQADDKRQLLESEQLNRIIIGKDLKAFIDTEFVALKWKDLLIQSHLTGNYNYHNLVAAIGMGSYFNVPKNQIKKAIESYIPTNQRSQIIHKKRTKILLDAYNANPTSMKAALDNFGKNGGHHKVVILGDMFELGNSAEAAHLEIAKLTQSFHFESTILIGANFYKTGLDGIQYYKSYEDFKSGFNPKMMADKFILIKGSRGMALERIVDLLD